MAAHSSILAWRISWAEEPGRLQTEITRGGHGLATKPPLPCDLYPHRLSKHFTQAMYVLNKNKSE